jgi:hypothetical protein
MTQFYNFYDEDTDTGLVFEAENGTQANSLACSEGIVFENTHTCGCCSNEVYEYDYDESGETWEELLEYYQEQPKTIEYYSLKVHFLDGTVKHLYSK